MNRKLFAPTLVLALSLAFVPAPATAGGDTLNVEVEITNLVPRVKGLVTVTDADGEVVAFAQVNVTSSIMGQLPAVQKGSTSTDGVMDFSYAINQFAQVPGPHDVEAIVLAQDGQTGVGTTTYVWPVG